MSRNDRRIPEKVVLEKTGPHVEVTAGPYTKRQLREMLLSSLSLLGGSSDREIELMRLSGVDPDDLRRIKDGEVFGADGKELFEDTSKEIAALRFLKLIANDQKPRTSPENDLALLLRSKGISNDLIDRILASGLTDETIRLLKALGLTDEEIAELFGIWKSLEAERGNESEESCPSVPSSSDEYMTAEGFYLMSNFRNPLTKALSAVVSKKPWNPGEYLGHWLLNYKICEERAQRRMEFDAELQAERERRRIKVTVEPNVSEADEEYEELPEDWDFIEYEAD